MAAPRAIQYLRKLKQEEDFVVWFEALRLRAAMQKIAIENLTPEECREYGITPR